MKEVESAAPFHNNVDAAMKFDPLAVIVTAPLPAEAESGLTEVSTGKGLLCPFPEVVCPPADAEPPPHPGSGKEATNKHRTKLILR
jgi:hypothetical protein